MVEEVVVTTGVQSSSQIVTTNTNQHPAPGQTKTTMFFCNTCNAPQVVYRDDGSPRFTAANRHSGSDDGCYREKFQIFFLAFIMGGARSKKHFRV